MDFAPDFQKTFNMTVIPFLIRLMGESQYPLIQVTPRCARACGGKPEGCSCITQ